MMDRRDWLAAVGAAVSTAMLAPLTPLERIEVGRRVHGLAAAGRAGVLADHELALVGTLADLIIPRTDTPGATDVGVPAFVDFLMADWYDDRERSDFRRGLAGIDARGTQRFGATTDGLTPAQRTELLTSLDGAQGDAASAEGAFGRLKSLTVYGYFTSERVQEEVLHTVIIPGRFDGCVPFPVH